MNHRDFENSKRLWSISKQQEQKDLYVSEMRNNLLKRNGEEDIYELMYTMPGKKHTISSCSVEDLFEIDGDMTPRGV